MQNKNLLKTVPMGDRTFSAGEQGLNETHTGFKCKENLRIFVVSYT
jgi:hypothetical protein